GSEAAGRGGPAGGRGTVPSACPRGPRATPAGAESAGSAYGSRRSSGPPGRVGAVVRRPLAMESTHCGRKPARGSIGPRRAREEGRGWAPSLFACLATRLHCGPVARLLHDLLGGTTTLGASRRRGGGRGWGRRRGRRDVARARGI